MKARRTNNKTVGPSSSRTQAMSTNLRKRSVGMVAALLTAMPNHDTF